MRGRKPKPTVLADLHGRPSKDKPPPYEPIPVTGDLDEPPDWLNDTQKDGWRYLMRHAPPGLLKHIDRGVLVAWVVAEDTHRRAAQVLGKTGLVIKSGPTLIPSPYLSIMNRQATIMMRAASELGFSPVSRPRVGQIASLPPPKPGANLGKAASRQPLGAFLAQHPASVAVN